MAGSGHIVIAGTGRAGTTLLVRILRRLGLETGFTDDDVRAAEANIGRAGLEYRVTKETAASLPLVVKSPQIVEILPQALSEGWLKVDLAIVPIREIAAATESRMEVHRRAVETGDDPVIAPGGLMFVRNPENQRNALTLAFYLLMDTLALHETPTCLISFPRFARDEDYCVRVLGPWLRRAQGIDPEALRAAHRAECDPALITVRGKEDGAPRRDARQGAALRDVIARKKRIETRIPNDPGLPRMGPAHLLDHLARLHRTRRPATYLEIGVEDGASLSLAACRAIAVDPVFRVPAEARAGKAAFSGHRTTSAAFFDADILGKVGATPDMAFLNGGHLIEDLLRDLAATERRMARDGVILANNCVPFSFLAAERTWDRTKTPFWTGDLWKLIPILREHRPDLRLEVIPAAPAGLVSLTGLDPQNDVLTARHDRIVDEWRDVSLTDFGVVAFTGMVAESMQSEETELA